VLEHVAVAVVERQRDGGLARGEREVVDLVEVDDALAALRERVWRLKVSGVTASGSRSSDTRW
jgi:hypothetical protein